jgi:antitoxin FitA
VLVRSHLSESEWERWAATDANTIEEQQSSEKHLPNALVPTVLAMIALHMATLTIRQLDDKTKSKLRVRAAQHGRSMEQEAREILRSALRTSPTARENLGKAIRERFAPLGGVDLELPRRDPIRQTVGFVE